jgi:hypothetical protein
MVTNVTNVTNENKKEPVKALKKRDFLRVGNGREWERGRFAAALQIRHLSHFPNIHHV